MTTDTTGRPAAQRMPAPAVRNAGLALAGVTAVVSGFSVFVNGYGVTRFDDPTTYTTAKNLVAAVVVAAVLVLHRRQTVERPEAVGVTPVPVSRRRRMASLPAIAVIGGSVPFVLFFEGLTRVSSSDAAFIHKTLIVWVAILAVAVLRERLSGPHLVAIILILTGYAHLAGGIGFPEFGVGETLILAATLCWSVEVVLSRSLLRRGVPATTVSTSRMAGGVVLLLAWAVARGAIGDLTGLTWLQWRWAALTGLLLAAYVVSWHHALARAQAVDVTAALTLGAVLTALLNAGTRGVAVEPVGLVLLLAGGGVVAVAMWIRPRRVAAS